MKIAIFTNVGIDINGYKYSRYTISRNKVNPQTRKIMKMIVEQVLVTQFPQDGTPIFRGIN
ncbi:MAG: hypothetical protein JWP44_3473 [Mucilaginibacter sp.]|nr:hypothetical protein [Mucilaginibacter sp.]